MPKALKIVIGVAVVLVVINFFKDQMIKTIFTTAASKLTRSSVTVDHMGVNFLNSQATLKGIKIQNPASFQDRLMLDAPEISVKFVPKDLFKKELHIQELKFDLKELIVVKNKEGKLNVDALKPSAEDNKNSAKPAKSSNDKMALKIDHLTLSIGKVIYKDYSRGGNPQTMSFDINIKNQEFRNINDPKQLISVIMMQAITKTTLSKIANLDLGAFNQGVQGALKGGLGLVGDSADQLENTAKKVLNLFN